MQNFQPVGTMGPVPRGLKLYITFSPLWHWHRAHTIFSHPTGQLLFLNMPANKKQQPKPKRKLPFSMLNQRVLTKKQRQNYDRLTANKKRLPVTFNYFNNIKSMCKQLNL